VAHSHERQLERRDEVDGGNVPNVAGETAVLGLTGAYTVTQNVGGLTLDAVDITNADAVLNLGSNSITLLGAGISNAGTIANSLGVGSINGPLLNLPAGRVNVINGTTLILLGNVTNDGLLTVNPTAGGSATALRIDAPLTIGGTGSIVLNRPTNQAQIAVSGVGVLTLGAGQTVRGQGSISGLLINNGTVQADVASTALVLSVGDKTNNGVMKAAGGTLEINGVAVNQGASGEIRGDGTIVTLLAGSISGGEIVSTAGGSVRGTSSINTLTDVDSAALVQVANGTALALAGGAFTNNGTVDVNFSLGGSGTSLRIDGPLTIDGTGEIVLRRPANQAQIIAGVDGSLVLGAGQVVRGQGQVSVGATNNGVIQADEPAATMLIHSASKINNNLMRAFGGTLSISGTTVTQAGSGRVHADGSDVTLSSATIDGGELLTSGGGVIRQVSGTSILSGVDSEADVHVNNATVMALVGGSYTNDGTITVNPIAGGSATTLRIDDELTIDGTGEIVLNAPSNRAQITSSGGATVTLGVGQTVRGHGQIVAPAVNHGIIAATVPTTSLDLNTNAKQNHGLMRAAGGTLAIAGIPITQFGGAAIHADGSDVTLSASTITGGAIDSFAGGLFRTIGGTSTLSGIASTADVQVANATALVLTGGSYVNNASITVNPSVGGSGTTMRIDGPVTISGAGDIVLNAPSNRAQIAAGTAGVLTLGPQQFLRGTGLISVPIMLEGTISPGLDSIGTIPISAVSTVITYAAGVDLDFPGADLHVDLGSPTSYDKVTGGSHTINGGEVVVSLVGGYVPALFATHTIIDGSAGSVVTGKFQDVTGPALPSPWVWKAGYTATDVVVGVTCPSDVNADFTVDILDFLDFIDDFSTCELQPGPCGNVVDADYNGDTFVDIIDFLDFIDAFGSGC
jgi:fibronectin-binding autotransporter adhesin